MGEFDDFSLLRTFAEAEYGIFAAPSVLNGVMRRRHACRCIGAVKEVRAHFYAIFAGRKIKNPAVVAICNAARQSAFETQRSGQK